MIEENQLRDLLNSALEEHLEAQADWRSRIPSMVLIYPLNQNYLISGLVGQKWMLKLCCMAPGEEHTLRGELETKENETNPSLGWYRLDDLGEWASPIIKWMKSKERILKAVSPRLGSLLEWVHKDAVTSFLKSKSEQAVEFDIPESPLPKGVERVLPVSSEWINLAGLNEAEYRILEDQGMIFLHRLFQIYEPCGNLHLFASQGQKLWLCRKHFERAKAQRNSLEVRRKKELLDQYRDYLKERIDKVHILGDSKVYDLKKVFVELGLSRRYIRQPFMAQTGYWGLMDSELRKLRLQFSYDYEEDGDIDYIGQMEGKNSIRPDELLYRETQAVIVGAPGSGKSVLLRYLTAKILDHQDYMPTFLELKAIQEADWEKAGGRLENLVFEKALCEPLRLGNSDRTLFKHEFHEMLKTGRVPIFLDGLDEVSGSELFLKLQHSVREFIKSTYRHNSLIISTRPYAFHDHFSQGAMLEMEIAPLNNYQVKQFVQHYYGDAKAKAIIGDLRKRRELRELASVPALLGSVVRLYQDEKVETSSRLQIYHQIVHLLIGEWDEEKGARRSFRIRSKTRKLDFLKHLAFAHLLSDTKTEIARRLVFTGQQILQDAESYCLSKNLNLNPEDLAEDVQASPILREIGKETFSFSHLTIQEYLAAVTLSERSDWIEIFCKHFFDSDVVEMEVLPMALGLASSPNDIYSILNQLPESLTFANFRLRLRGLAYASAVGVEHLSIITDRLVEFITENNTEGRRYFNILFKNLSSIESRYKSGFISRISSLLSSDDLRVRCNAVDALGEIGQEESVDDLLKLVGIDDEDLTSRSIRALGKIGSQKSVPQLIKTLRLGEPKYLSATIAALSQIGGEEAGTELLKFLKRRNTYEHFGAVEALAEIGGEKAVEGLIELSEKGRPYCRENAIKTLVEIGASQAEAVLLNALKDRSPNVRGSAIEALRDVWGNRHLREVAEMTKDENEWVRVKALRAIGSFDKEIVKSYLIAALNDKSKHVTEVAATDLGYLAGKEETAVLIKTLKHRHPRTRAAAAVAIGEIKDAEAIGPLLRALNDRDSYVRGRAVEALGNIDKVRFLNHVLQALDDNSNYVRYMAVNTLGCIGGEKVTDRLLRALREDDWDEGSLLDDELKGAIAEALGKIGGDQVIEALITLLSDTDVPLIPVVSGDDTSGQEYYAVINESRKMAAKALGEIGGYRSVAGLLGFIKDEDWEVRCNVIIALGKIGGGAVVAGLLTALEDEDEEIRNLASGGLMRLGGPMLAACLIGAFVDKDTFVRRKAIEYVPYYADSNEISKMLSRLAMTDSDDGVRFAARSAEQRLIYKLHLVAQ